MSEAWEEGGDLGSWSPFFSRHLNNWELGEAEALFHKLQPLVVRREVDDVMSWRDNKSDKFSVNLERSFP